jgi:hypothetical protein
VNARVSKKIRKIITSNAELGFVKRDYDRAKNQYKKLSEEGRKDFLDLLEKFYSNNQTNKG